MFHIKSLETRMKSDWISLVALLLVSSAGFASESRSGSVQCVLDRRVAEPSVHREG